MSYKYLFLKYLGMAKFKPLVLFCMIGIFPISLVNAQSKNPREIIPFDDDKSIEVFDKKNCKLCQSEFREIAENAYEEGQSMKR